jgi:lipopolysaccharide transport system permease protein
MQELIIEAGRTERHYWRDLWRYRELFIYLAWRDLLIRYKQTVVGVLWSLIRPLLSVVVLTVVFSKLAKMPSGGVPYSLLACCGTLPWTFFATAMAESSNSLVTNSNLISKVYFPRLIVPASSVITCFVDFMVAAVIMLMLMVWFRFVPSVHIFALPFFILLAFAASVGVGVWLAALMVEYRDFRMIVPFIVQFGMYATPVGYLSSKISTDFGEKWRVLYSLNPMVGVIDGFRWAILGRQNDLFLPGLILSIVMSTLLLASGIWYFRKTEKSFADVI